MAECVRLIVQRKVRLDDIVASLKDSGAINVSVDPRSGDPYEGVDRYFYISFDDPQGTEVRRTAFGFHCAMSEEHPEGWTRFQLGADARGFRFVHDCGERFGGELYDNKTNQKIEFDVEPALALAC